MPEDLNVILKICAVGEPVLRQRARALTREDLLNPLIQCVIEHMRETMHDAPGVGLAAPQVGLSIQLAMIEDRPENMAALSPAEREERGRVPVPFHVIVNPVLRMETPPEVEFFEGCLSLPGFSALVRRAARVRVECLNHRGEAQVIEASGWYARILQHEIDHLNGTMYLDRMRSRSLTTLDNMARHWKSRSVEEVKELLGLNGE